MLFIKIMVDIHAVCLRFFLASVIYFPRGRGALVFQAGYHPCKTEMQVITVQQT